MNEKTIRWAASVQEASASKDKGCVQSLSTSDKGIMETIRRKDRREPDLAWGLEILTPVWCLRHDRREGLVVLGLILPPASRILRTPLIALGRIGRGRVVGAT